jgi:cation diffusion facilitator family transporter
MDKINLRLKNKTLAVIIMSVVAMFLGVGYGLITHSIALVTEGLHMGAHVLALLITYIIFILAEKYQDKIEKLNALGGYTSAILLGITAIVIICESVSRLFNPEPISFNTAIVVAVFSFVVNFVCILIMGERHHHEGCCECLHNENLNYKGAYLHILADVLMSVLTVIVLLLGKYFGFIFLDAIVGILGGLVILRWTYNLIKCSIKILV